MAKVTDHSHETLCEIVDTIFTTILSDYVPGQTTEQEISETVCNYVNERFSLPENSHIYVKTKIGTINYMDVSNLLDDVVLYEVSEKCCKYDQDNQIFLTVLMLSGDEDSKKL